MKLHASKAGFPNPEAGLSVPRRAYEAPRTPSRLLSLDAGEGCSHQRLGTLHELSEKSRVRGRGHTLRFDAFESVWSVKGLWFEQPSHTL